MIMSDKPNDGNVAIHYGEIEDTDYLAVEDYLPALPNTHTADLLAAQFCSLMIKEGYIVEDHVQPKPVHLNRPSGTSNASGIPPDTAIVEMQQNSEAVSARPLNEAANPSNSGNTSVNSSQNIPSTRVLPPGNSQALQISKGLLSGVSVSSRLQQPDPQASLYPQLHQNQHPLLQQQHPQLQIGNHMIKHADR